jgi:hypothetical protein
MAQQQTVKEQLMLSIPGMFPDKSVDWKARAVGAIRSFGEDECRALLNLQPEEVKLAAIAASMDGAAAAAAGAAAGGGHVDLSLQLLREPLLEILSELRESIRHQDAFVSELRTTNTYLRNSACWQFKYTSSQAT